MTNQQEPYKRFTGQAGGKGPRSYVIAPEKALIVDLAIRLSRPLIVEGEAGCGKTQLAYAIANELELDDPIVLPVRSTSRANDLFYRFDALRRLQDSNIKARHEKAEFAHNYITLEPLGRAIAKGRQVVVLIDEVDKGDVDFQNDLLFALERFEFPIDEIPEDEKKEAGKEDLAPTMSWPGGARPIVVFTSNREKQLPTPFLRRCFYLELTFPESAEDLEEIVAINLRDRYEQRLPGSAPLESISETVIRNAVNSFREIRARADEDNAVKKPATAELIDWVHVLHDQQIGADAIQGDSPPHWSILFRNAEDIERHAANAAAADDSD